MGKILHTSQHTYIYSHIHYNKITMARNPYELRMECLQMAEARLQQRFDETKQRYEFLDEKGIIQDPKELEMIADFSATNGAAAPANGMMGAIPMEPGLDDAKNGGATKLPKGGEI